MKKPCVYIIAGEVSGDLLGVKLIKALKTLNPEGIDFKGIGGDAMQGEGCASLFPMHELSLMGLLEIIPHIPNLLARIRQTVEDIIKTQPDVVVTIDSPDFNFRVGKALRNSNIPVVHYTMPSVWAWREKRAEKLSTFLSKGLALLPFEPPYFTKYGLECEFVGHPIIESEALNIQSNPFRKHYGIPETQPLICMLPGSRRSEIKYLLPIFSKTLHELRKKRSDFMVVVPTFGQFRQEIEEEALSWNMPSIVTVDPDHKYHAMQASNVALAASGTVALELAMLNVPMVIGYKVNILTALVARLLLKIHSVCLVNIILQKPIIPEFLQENAQPSMMALALDEILLEKGKTQKKAFMDLRTRMHVEGESPSLRAARAIQGYLTT